MLLLWNEQTNQKSAATKQLEEAEAEKARLRAQILASMPPIPIDPVEVERRRISLAAYQAEQHSRHSQLATWLMHLMLLLSLFWFIFITL